MLSRLLGTARLCIVRVRPSLPMMPLARWCSNRIVPGKDSVPIGGGGVLGTKAREAYLFVYTCKVCGNRSERKISKRAYHHGVVLVKCTGCDKNHLVADNLKWFDDEPISIVDIMRAQGEDVLTGVVNESWKLGSSDQSVPVSKKSPGPLTVEDISSNPDLAKMMDEVLHIEGMSSDEVVDRLGAKNGGDHACDDTCTH